MLLRVAFRVLNVQGQGDLLAEMVTPADPILGCNFIVRHLVPLVDVKVNPRRKIELVLQERTVCRQGKPDDITGVTFPDHNGTVQTEPLDLCVHPTLEQMGIVIVVILYLENLRRVAPVKGKTIRDVVVHKRLPA